MVEEDRTMTEKKEGAIDEIVENLMEDPDAPEKGNTRPPQTIANEPEDAPER